MADSAVHRVRDTGAGVAERASSAVHRTSEIEPRTNPMWLILPLALLALLGLWLFNRARSNERRIEQPPIERSYQQTPSDDTPYRPRGAEPTPAPTP